MPRRPRIKLADVPQHLVQRGVYREPCFFAEEDYHCCLHGLQEAADDWRCVIHPFSIYARSPVGAHRIESGFYRSFNMYGADFDAAEPRKIEPLNIAGAAAIGTAVSIQAGELGRIVQYEFADGSVLDREQFIEMYCLVRNSQSSQFGGYVAANDCEWRKVV